jgi:glycosyltransferase involved in cell wall biosynthesis
MRIGIFTRTYSPNVGGLERLAEILANEFTNRGHNVSVITDVEVDDPHSDKELPYKVVRTKKFLGRFSTFREMDVILFFNLSLVGLLSLIPTFKPAVMVHQGTYHTFQITRKPLELFKRLLTLFYQNIAGSKFVASYIFGRTEVIPNTYTTLPISKDIKRTRNFVFLGRLELEKGCMLALKAFNSVLSKYPTASMTIIGTGSERISIDNYIKLQGIGGSVTLLGTVTGQELIDELSKHHTMVIPSIWNEPFGMVALYGLAYCDNVISTRVGGLPEAVGGFGMIVTPQEEDIRDAMFKVLAGDSRPTEIIKAEINAHLDRHSPKNIAAAYLKVLEETSNA